MGVQCCDIFCFVLLLIVLVFLKKKFVDVQNITCVISCVFSCVVRNILWVRFVCAPTLSAAGTFDFREFLFFVFYCVCPGEVLIIVLF